MSSNLPLYEWNGTLENVSTFLLASEQQFQNAGQAIGGVGTMGWIE